MVMSTKLKERLIEEGNKWIPATKIADLKWHLAKKQGNKCELCLRDLLAMNQKTVALDHNHKSKLVRGVLCMPCNQAIGQADGYSFIGPDWWRRVADYLEKPDLPYIYPEKKPKSEIDKAKKVAAKRKAEKAAKPKRASRNKKK